MSDDGIAFEWPIGPLDSVGKAYARFLISLDWTDSLVMAGSREGRNKFLSNAWLSACGSCNKYYKTQLVSADALSQLKMKSWTGLVWEHVIPKQRYIQGPCERLAVDGNLTERAVSDLLYKYWITATITKTEDNLLSRSRMPANWDDVDVFARYRETGIELVVNPFFPVNSL